MLLTGLRFYRFLAPLRLSLFHHQSTHIGQFRFNNRLIPFIFAGIAWCIEDMHQVCSAQVFITQHSEDESRSKKWTDLMFG